MTVIYPMPSLRPVSPPLPPVTAYALDLAHQQTMCTLQMILLYFNSHSCLNVKSLTNFSLQSPIKNAINHTMLTDRLEEQYMHVQML